MDPDMVRQQEEAEREALGLVRKKPAAASAASMAQRSPATAAENSAERQYRAQERGSNPETVSQFPPREGFVAVFRRFISFGIVGAVLGIGLGAAAVNLLALPFDRAGAVVFVTAGLMAGLCAIASLFAWNRNA
jgi:hypothetical protein